MEGRETLRDTEIKKERKWGERQDLERGRGRRVQFI